MRLVICMFFLLISLDNIGCGYFAPDNDTYVYFNILDQTIVSDHNFDPFLREQISPFYNMDDNYEYSSFNEGNLNLWSVLLPDLNLEQIDLILYQKKGAHEIWDSFHSKHKENIKQYINFANRCSETFSVRNRYSWDYTEILKQDPENKDQLLKEAVSRYESANQEQLKLRYGYQLVRIYHYTDAYQKAIDFYKSEIENQFDKNEIYYYLLNQVAGCYYSLADTRTAGMAFLEVMSFSQDKKESAAVSYRWCSLPILKMKEHPDLFLTQQMLKYDFDQNMINSLLENYALLAPENPRLEVVIMREINYIERIKLPHPSTTRYFYEELENPKKIFNSTHKALKKITKSILANKEVKNRDFWSIISSYLSFLEDDIPTAKNTLKNVKKESYNSAVHALELAYEVFSWSSMDSTKENLLASELSVVFGENGFSNYWQWHDYKHNESWKFGILNQVAKLYFNQEDHAKSYLCHGTSSNLHSLSSKTLIESFRNFHEKKNKNSFEKILTKNLKVYNGWRSQENPTDEDITDYLNYSSALIHMQNDQPHLALKYLQNEKDKTTGKHIFSNNIKERSEKPKLMNLTDSVVYSDWFSFIPDTLSLKDQAEVLVKLKSLAKNSATTKGILANYLIGNYYINSSGSGYFRKNLKNYGSSYYYYFSKYPDKSISMDERINQKKIQDYYWSRDYYVTDLNLASISFNYYETVIKNSTNKELKGRTLFMMAKCELNRLYNEQKNFVYDPTKKTWELGPNHFSSFKTLSEEYVETKIYDQILKECSFFKYYVIN